jgi:hypothetical protein
MKEGQLFSQYDAWAVTFIVSVEVEGSNLP